MDTKEEDELLVGDDFNHLGDDDAEGLGEDEDSIPEGFHEEEGEEPETF